MSANGRQPAGIRKAILATATLALLAGLASPAAAQNFSSVAQSKIVERGSKWTEKFTTAEQRIPVIVEFRMPSLPDFSAAASESDRDNAQKSAVRSEQERLLSGLSNGLPSLNAATANPDVGLKLMPFSPQFAFAATARELEKLAADPAVVKIYEDLIMDFSLIQTLTLTQMATAYTQGATGAGYRVAVIDTGSRRSHEFLSARVTHQACFNTNQTYSDAVISSLCPGGATEVIGLDSANDCDSSFLSGCGHGTHVAGIAAGFNTAPSGGEPAHGIARNGSVLAISIGSKLDWNDDSLTDRIVPLASDAVRALNYIYGVRTTLAIASINMSFGSFATGSATACDGASSYTSIFNLLRAANVAPVVAAGNDSDSFKVGEPGCVSSAITVASSTKSDGISYFSNWGNMVDVVAPGGANSGTPSDDILSSYTNAPNAYANLPGTSMASPVVAGAIAAIRTARPSATVDQIETALENTGVSLTRGSITKPRIRVANALAQIPGGGPASPPYDNFANRFISTPPTTVGQTVSVTSTNVGANKEAGEPNHAGQAGATTSVWGQFTPSVTGPYVIDTVGSNFDTVLAIYTGNAVNALTPVASNDNGPAGVSPRSQLSLNLTAGVPYKVAIAGVGGASGTVVARATRSGSAAPANNNFANRTILPGLVAGQSRAVAGSNVGATKEAGEPNHAGVATATTSIWYSFTPTQSGLTALTTTNSTFNTVIAVYVGASLANLTPLAWNDNASGGVQTSSTAIHAVAGTTYHVAIAGVGGATGETRLNIFHQGGSNNYFANALTINPALTQNGTSRTTGTNVGSNREAGEPFHHGLVTANTTVWWKFTPASSGVVIVSTSNSNFDTVLGIYSGSTVGGLVRLNSNDNAAPGTNISAAGFNAVAGTTYYIAVAGANGATGNIWLNISGGGTSAGPVNNNFASRTILPGMAGGQSRTVAGSNVGATKEPGEPNHAGVATATTSIWYSFTPTQSGLMALTTTNSSFNTVIAVYIGTSLANLTPLAWNDNAGGGVQTSSTAIHAVAGTTYHVAIAGVGGATGETRLNIFHQGGNNNNFANAQLLNPPLTPNGTSRVSGTNASADKEAGEPDHDFWPTATKTVWWNFIPASSGVVVATTANSDFDTVLAIYTGNSVGALTRLNSNDDAPGAPPGYRQSAAGFNAVAGTTYRIAVSGYAGLGGNIWLNVTGGGLGSMSGLSTTMDDRRAMLGDDLR